jgi:alkanesulfonate monooxygenase SsuD/methylene tetrahydromethanopterin reductase-like flavin-dependent oxidoreductase (luciferase family)
MPSKSLILSVAFDASGDLTRRALALEALGVDLLIIGGAKVLLDPLVVASWLAPKLRHIGLVTILPALTTLPFHAARALSAMDFMSGGHLGWMPSTLEHDAVVSGFGAHMQVPDDEREAKARDFIDATTRLWESWDDDALIIDKESGVYLDSDKVRRVDYRGKYFTVMGPLNAARPPQSYPLFVQDEADPLHRVTAARTDVLLTGRTDPAALQALRAGAPATRLLLRRDGSGAGLDLAADLFARGLIDGVHLESAPAQEVDASIAALRQCGVLADGSTPGHLRAKFGRSSISTEIKS